MNKKTILNRTLPLIIALGVILVVAICVTVFSGEKKAPQISTGSDSYLTVDMKDYGYDASIEITNKDIYERLKNGDSGLTFLVDMLDASLLTKEGYLNKYVDAESLSEENAKKLQEAVKEAILGANYEVDEFDDDEQDKIDAAIKKWESTLKYSYAIDAKGKATPDAVEGVKVTLTPELQQYYGLILARKEYTRDQLGEDQVESYKEFIDAYEEYLEELHKFNEEEVSTSPAVPTDASTITSSSVKSDWEKENVDSFWAIYVTYATQSEAEKALLQAGVVVYSSKWYEYEGIIDLDDYKEDGKRKYASEAAYYAKEGNELGRYEILNKLIELYNNANPKAKLEEEVHYSLKQINVDAYKALEGKDVNYETEAFDGSVDAKNYDAYNINATEYEALSETEKALYGVTEISATAYDALDEEKQAAYTKVEDKYTTYTTYKAVIFTIQGIPADEKDLENKEFALYHTAEDLTSVSSSIKSWISSLSAAYADGGKWASSYSKSIQAKGEYYVVGAKFFVNKAETFADKYGDMYDTEKFEEDGTYGKDYLGYVEYTVNEDGEKVFDFENSAYWQHVLELLDDSVTSANINTYMAELRNEYKLVIYDAKLESAYTSTYTSDYKNTSKSSKTIVAKLSGKNADGSAYKFEVKADDLYSALENAFGAEIATDAYQYEKVLYQNEIIDYAKYKAGYDMDDCVIVTDYALAKKGTKDAVTSWVKASIDGTVTFNKVDGTQEYDVLVRKGTSKKDKVVEVFELANAEDLEIEDTTAKKTTVTVTIAVEENYRDSQDKYELLDETIEALKLYFTNGNFTEQGYAPSYGWKNFLRDYYAEFYGISVRNNNDLRLYLIYEETVADISEDYAKLESEALGDDKWAYYLPLMQKQFDKFLSVDAIHFLISVQDEEGKDSDPEAADTVWTAEQKEAAVELYELVVKILAKTKKADQGTVLQHIADEFAAAPKFIPGKGDTTEEQQAYIDGLYAEYYLGTEVFDTPIEYTTVVKGITLEVSKYKTLGLTVKYQDLSTVTADQMVERFEEAVKELWLERNAYDAAMAEGSTLEDNVIYGYEGGTVNPEKILVTEYGYHVLVANKFTGKAAYEYDTNEESADFENKVVISLRDLTKETIKLFEANDASTDELSDYQMKQIETYYKTIVTDFESSYWYQLNVMKGIKADIEAGLLQFATEEQKASALDAAEYYIDAYYSSLTYVSNGFDWAMELMEIVVDGYASNYSEYTEEVANLKAIVALAKAELAELEISAEGTISGDYSRAEKAEFAELYKEFLEAAEAFAAIQ